MRPSTAISLVVLSVLLPLAGCSSGGGSSTAKFKVTDVSVKEGQQWKINRPIDITFNRDVDFSTVSLNTIQIVDQHGLSATGFFTQPLGDTGKVLRRVVRFQPTCPIKLDLSDAGLVPSSNYRLAVMGSGFGGATVKSSSGDPLLAGKLVGFHTPDSTDPLDLFLDVVPGPPVVRVRGFGGLALDEEKATLIRVGGQSVYFEINPANQKGELPAGFAVPLNHYSIPENQVQVVLEFNQPVLATEQNVSASLLAVEYSFDGLTDWKPIQTEVRLLENCTETGASVLIVPRGILPQQSFMRVVVRQGFADITGDTTSADATGFATMQSSVAGGDNPLFPGVTNPEVDELLEPFSLAGNDVGSLEDNQTAFASPNAVWGQGRLQASFGFGGTGGPGGDFDWHIPNATDVILNTVSDTIFGGPGGAQLSSQAVINGVIDVRDVFIPESSRLILVGPNRARILASGTVRIEGEISVRGSDNPGVTTLNTTAQPEAGAKGQAGGGDGGVGSYLTNQSTPRGGTGNGAYNSAGQGGEGGESSYSKNGKENRRAAGGGGGRFGPDVRYDYFTDDTNVWIPNVRCQILVGLDAEYGALGGPPPGKGAESQTDRAQGGAIAPSPFIDEFDDNNFFGVMLTADGELVRGELDRVWAGAGGGAGGDASNTDKFPQTPFNPGGDEKGAGGGGGAGGLEVLAIGDVIIGKPGFPGSIAAEGGTGGGGENTGFFDRVGGGSGGGSGGHIVISSAANIVVYGRAPSAEEDVQLAGNWWYADKENLSLHNPRPLSAVGGQSGAGKENRGGANETGPGTWDCDRIPWEYAEGNVKKGSGNLTPFDDSCFTVLIDFTDDVAGPVMGAGGDGGPGIIQLHVENPDTQLHFPDIEAEQGLTWGTGLDVTPCCAPPPLGWHRPGDPDSLDQMIPFFGKTSIARSKWVALGLARVVPGGGTNQVMLRFEGTQPDGIIPRDGTLVDQLDPILGPEVLGNVGNPPYLLPGGRTIVFDGTLLGPNDQLYLENTNLLRQFTVWLADTNDASHRQLFRIVAASNDTGSGELTLFVDPNGPRLDEFLAVGQVEASLVPHWFRMVTLGVEDSYPVDTQVALFFEGTGTDPLTGGPDEVNTSGEVTVIDDLNAQNWDFVRFRVEFNLDEDGNGVDLSTPRPALDHLRFSFTF